MAIEKQDGAEIVDAGFARLDFFMQEQRKADDRQQADRQVDPENPRPGKMIHDQAASEGASYGGNRPDAGQNALHLGAFLKPVEIADDGHRHGLDGSGAQPLQQAECDQ